MSKFRVLRSKCQDIRSKCRVINSKFRVIKSKFRPIMSNSRPIMSKFRHNKSKFRDLMSTFRDDKSKISRKLVEISRYLIKEIKIYASRMLFRTFIHLTILLMICSYVKLLSAWYLLDARLCLKCARGVRQYREVDYKCAYFQIDLQSVHVTVI